MKKIKIIGGGPGNIDYILPLAKKEALACDYITGDKRLLDSFKLSMNSDKVHRMEKIMETIDWLRNLPEDSRVGILVSGDPLMYSMFRLVKRNFPETEIDIIPGIGSIQAFAARLGESMEEAKILSGHGRNLTEEKLLLEVSENKKVFLLCDKIRTPSWIAETMIRGGMSDIEMAVGSRVSYSDEIVFRGAASELVGKIFSDLCVVFIKNDQVRQNDQRVTLRDSDFIRNKTPMTREEVRWIILGKLNLKIDSVVWDIGAGTGSISVEAALRCRYGQVIAVEKNTEALNVLKENREKFNLFNMEIREGNARDLIDQLIVPTHIFIGGAGGELEDLLQWIGKLPKGIKIIISCVTLETLTQAYDVCGKIEALRKPELVTIHIEQSRPVGRYRMMEGGHPITLIMTETEGECK